jgi:chromosome segregation ATPase
MSQLSTRSPEIIANEIIVIKDQVRNFALQSSVEAKALLPHGEWGNWLKNSVDYSQSTANNLMKIAAEYSGNSQALGNLNYSQAIALFGIPEAEREKFVEENNVQHMSSRELQQAVKEKQKLEKQLKEAQDQAGQERKAREELAKRQGELEAKTKEYDELVAKLNAELEKSKTTPKTSNDTKASDKLKDSLQKSKAELDESKKRIKELESELKKKPIDVPATTVIEKVPEAVEQELADLRKKLALNNNKAALKFSMCFENLNKGVQELLVALEDLKATSPDDYEKYKNAVVIIADKMKEHL